MVPRSDGTAWEILAPAKINLYLEVLGRRADGFHDLETFMLPIRVYDHLRWVPAPRDKPSILTVSQPHGQSPIPSDQGNLVLRAAQLLAAKAGIRAFGRFHLVKRIPVQAGMGGGSSDAAATLLLANAAWAIGFSQVALFEMASQLGSDVPFFLNPQPSICRSRGELIERVDGNVRLNFVVVKPTVGLSTAQIFRVNSENRHATQANRQECPACVENMIEALCKGAVGRACRYLKNRLEAAAALQAPEIFAIKAGLKRLGCWGQVMTGSGSAVVGVARSTIHARRVARAIAAQNFGTVMATASGW